MTMRPEAHGACNDTEHSPAGCDAALSTLIRLAIEQDPGALADFLVKRLATVLPSGGLAGDRRQAIEVHQANELRARKVVLVDGRGRDRVVIDSCCENNPDDSDAAEIRILDAEGNTRAELTASGTRWFDGNGTARLALTLDSEGVPAVRLNGPGGNAVATLAASDLADEDSDSKTPRGRAFLRLGESDAPSMSILSTRALEVHDNKRDWHAKLAVGYMADPAPAGLNIWSKRTGREPELRWPEAWPAQWIHASRLAALGGR